MKKITALLSICTLFLLGACSSTTVLRTTDPDVAIYVDGEFKGKGRAVHTDTKISGATTQVELRKEGHQPENYVLSKSEEANVGAIVGGVFFLVPFLWTMGYKNDHVYEFKGSKVSGQLLQPHSNSTFIR